MRVLFYYLPALFSALLLSGCLGITQPTDKTINEMTAHHFNQEFVGLFTVVSTTKENGYKQNDTHYVAEITINARAERNLEEYASAIMQDSSLTPLEKMAQTVNLGLLKLALPQFEAGDELEFKRNYLFIKTDNGWLLKKELTENDKHPDSI